MSPAMPTETSPHVLPAPTAEELARYAAPLRTLTARMAEVVVGQDQMIRGLMIGLLIAASFAFTYSQTKRASSND